MLALSSNKSSKKNASNSNRMIKIRKGNILEANNYTKIREIQK